MSQDNVALQSDANPYLVFKQALEASIEGVAILDRDENFIFVNRAFSAIFGYTKYKRFPLKTWKALFPTTELIEFQSAIIPQLKNRGRLRVEACGIKRWGVRFPMEISMTLLESGETLCIVKDISKRKKFEKEIKLMGMFATHDPYPVIRFDLAGLIIMANPAAIKTFKLNENDKYYLKDIIPGCGSIEINDLIINGKIFSCSRQIENRHFHFLIRGIPSSNFGHVYTTDITELVEAREALTESQAFLRKVIDTDPNLIFVKDRNGRFILVNQKVAELYGTSCEAIVGKCDADFNSNAEEVTAFMVDDQEVIDKRISKTIIEQVTNAQGETRTYETVKIPLVSRNEQTHVLGVSHDITDERKLQKQLIQSQKMEAIGKLAGGIAHDFNNLLTGIFGYTNLLKQVYRQPEKVLNTGDMIQSAAERASALTQKLLGFARKGKYQHVPVDIHKIISETFQLIKRTIEEDIIIQENLGNFELLVMGDPVQLQQVILNLAINARDAIRLKDHLGSSETIGISTKKVVLSKNDPTLTLPPGSYAEICVSDSGCGIPTEYLDRIFEPFFTTKEDHGGTGMGLAMVYGIVQNHGGLICVLSHSADEGTIFKILLPLTDHLVSTKSDQIDESPIKGQGTILLVDDHPVIRESTGSLINSLGYTVLLAKDGVDAVHAFQLHHEDIDLVILDMIMPNMGAKDCLIELRKIQPDIKAILSTGYANNNRVQEILDNGPCGFVQKPYQLIELSKEISKMMSMGAIK